MASWVIQSAGTFRPPMDVPLSTELGLDVRVFIFTIAITFITSIMFGLLPAVQATKPDLVPALKNEALQGSRRSRLRNGLVAAQVALSLTLMIAAGLVLRGLQRMQFTDL